MLGASALGLHDGFGGQVRHPHGAVCGVHVLAPRSASLVVVDAQLVRTASTQSRECETGQRGSVLAHLQCGAGAPSVSCIGNTRTYLAHTVRLNMCLREWVACPSPPYLRKGCVAPAAAVEGALPHQAMHP